MLKWSSRVLGRPQARRPNKFSILQHQNKRSLTWTLDLNIDCFSYLSKFIAILKGLNNINRITNLISKIVPQPIKYSDLPEIYI